MHSRFLYVGVRWHAAARVEAVDDELEDCADAFGNLSIDENREVRHGPHCCAIFLPCHPIDRMMRTARIQVRYHGNASGLQLLAQSERSDGRNAKGIWYVRRMNTPNYVCMRSAAACMCLRCSQVC